MVTAFAYGGNLGPTEVARHMRGVSAHEIYTAGNKHADAGRIHKASADVINAFAKLDVARMWGDGRAAAVDGSQIETWENNLLAESSIRYGGFGGIAFRLISDTYIALFSHFIPCGVWEAVYILDSLLSNDSAIRPESVHADTQGQSLPVFGLAALLGFELLPRIRNWHDLIFYRPDPRPTTGTSIPCSATTSSTGTCSRSTGPNFCAPGYRSGKGGCRRWRCCGDWATTPGGTGSTRHCGNWAASSGP